VSGYLEDTGDWPFRESTPSPPPERDPEPEVAVSLTEPESEPEPEPGEHVPEEPSADVIEEQARVEEPAAAHALPEPDVEEAAAADEPERVVAEGLVIAEPAPVAEVAAEPEPEHAEGGLDIPAGYTVLEGAPNGERRTVGIVVGRFNGEITNRLLESALTELEEAGVGRDAVTVMPVPGAFELPLAAMALAKTRRYACVVALGCVIRGETPHFDFVASEAASGLQLAAIETGVPVSFGLLTCDTPEQAEARVGKGAEAVRAALEMADLFAQVRAQAAGSR
jgi:6,7-dimethyl-8-ribityllumazine synthase